MYILSDTLICLPLSGEIPAGFHENCDALQGYIYLYIFTLLEKRFPKGSLAAPIGEPFLVPGRKNSFGFHVEPSVEMFFTWVKWFFKGFSFGDTEVSLVCVVKPDEFWDKKVTHFCFWKEKDRLGFEVILVSANKLTRYIEPCQLTDEFGGSLVYDHIDWVNKRLVFEKFTKESSSLLDELVVINDSEKSSQLDKERPPDCNFLPSLDPETVLQTGHELLSELQQRRFNGAEGGGVAWSPMDDELLAQPQVMKLLDSLREQYTKYQEVCRQRSKRSQLEDIQTKVMQVVNWLEGPGTEQLRTQWGIGDSIRASQALQQKHEEIESQHSEWFAVYVELNQQIAALLSAGDEEDLVELKGLQQQLSDVCYRQASQLESRQNVLQSAHEFHGTAQDLSQQLDGLLGMLCADVAPADGAAIQQTLKHLEEKLKSVEGALVGLREKGQVLMDQMSNQTSWSYGKDVPIDNKDNVDHIQGVMEDMQLRKQRCEDMVDVRRLKMLQMVQLFKCEEDASQAVEWLGELLDALLKTHIRLGDDSQETKVLLEKHKKFVDVAQSTYDYGRQLLQATVVLCQSLRCSTRSSGDTLPRLNRVWKQFTVTTEERVHRLEMACSFHTAAEKGDLPVEVEQETYEEVETVGKALLDRLTVPVIFPDGSNDTCHFDHGLSILVSIAQPMTLLSPSAPFVPPSGASSTLAVLETWRPLLNTSGTR
uniref:CRAL-TRIO domain-containing protein n=1 Tax=Oncorhynchus tshawytscha TaxID=74940 RepID=A0A8C8GIF7_ONCTS